MIIKKIDAFSDIYEMLDLPKINHYKVVNLTKKPKIEIYDGLGNKEEIEYKEDIYYIDKFYKTDNYKGAMNHLKDKYNPIDFAKNWSLFLTDDLSGNRHGLDKLTPNLIEGTELYKKAYRWATGADIRFTSGHKLDKDTFTNVKMEHFTIYSDISFSVEISLEKNMTLITHKKRTDKLHELVYFVYYDGQYRAVHMQTVL